MPIVWFLSYLAVFFLGAATSCAVIFYFIAEVDEDRMWQDWLDSAPLSQETEWTPVR